MHKTEAKQYQDGHAASPKKAVRKIANDETAQYISDMVLELRNMAKAADLSALQDLLELCFYEAFSAANRVDIPEGEIEHLKELSAASKTGQAL
jgi:hypothetical protein